MKNKRDHLFVADEEQNTQGGKSSFPETEDNGYPEKIELEYGEVGVYDEEGEDRKLDTSKDIPYGKGSEKGSEMLEDAKGKLREAFLAAENLTTDAEIIDFLVANEKFCMALRSRFQNKVDEESANMPARDHRLMGQGRSQEATEEARAISPLPEPDLSGSTYPLYPGKRQADPYEWIGKIWGKWLKHFNDDLDYDELDLSKLIRLDKGLHKALYAHSTYIEKTHGVRREDYIPKKTVTLIRRAKQSSEKSRKEMYSIINTYYRHLK